MKGKKSVPLDLLLSGCCVYIFNISYRMGLDLVNKIIEIVKNGNKKHPLVKSYYEGTRFYSDFIDMLGTFENKLSESECRGIQGKVENAFNTDDIQIFLQCMCELIVLYYLLRNYSDDNFVYEPKYNGGYNPECSFMAGETCVNVEVKTPSYSSRIEQEQGDGIKIFSSERIDCHKEIIQEIKEVIGQNKQVAVNVHEIMRMDNKLKDFLVHSQKKFPEGKQYFNILVIALDIVGDMDEWYSYIFGQNGAFTEKTYIKEKYSNVDAILLCTPVCGIKGWEKFSNLNVWKLEETICILLLDPRKEKETKGSFYFECGIDIFGPLSRAFLSYQHKLDETSENLQYINSYGADISYLRFKELDLRIISSFLKTLGCCTQNKAEADKIKPRK